MPPRAAARPALLSGVRAGPPRARRWLNYALFQAGWFACVLGAAAGDGLVGPLAVAAIVALELALSDDRRGLAVLTAALALAGFGLDSALAGLGVLEYAGDGWTGPPAPAWIVALWALFATTLGSSMRWVASRAWLPAAFGALGGPLSYLAGERLGALEILPDRRAAVAALALAWGLACALAWALAARIERRARP